ncbi:MAG: hypothetical protein IJD39_06085, partial [Clostridia bacterium]|nr:hypothetical protein [Clostridia bacterium]
NTCSIVGEEMQSAAAACTPRGEKFWRIIYDSGRIFHSYQIFCPCCEVAQENLHVEKNDPSFFSSVLTLSTRRSAMDV